jgi:hypothetical protein
MQWDIMCNTGERFIATTRSQKNTSFILLSSKLSTLDVIVNGNIVYYY